MIKYVMLSEVSEEQRKELTEKGYHVYDMQTSDDMRGFVVVPRTLVNLEGVIVAGSVIPLHAEDFGNGKKREWLNDEEFLALDVEEIRPDDDPVLKDILSRNKNRNYHFHIKGKMVDTYWTCRTGTRERAEELKKKAVKRVHETDPSARAYEFGNAGQKEFSRIFKSIKTPYYL